MQVFHPVIPQEEFQLKISACFTLFFDSKEKRISPVFLDLLPLIRFWKMAELVSAKFGNSRNELKWHNWKVTIANRPLKAKAASVTSAKCENPTKWKEGWNSNTKQKVTRRRGGREAEREASGLSSHGERDFGVYLHPADLRLRCNCWNGRHDWRGK